MELSRTRTHYLYVLRCPVSGTVRYVGITRHLGERRRDHLAGATSTLPVLAWREALAQVGLQPVFEPVMVFGGEDCWHEIGGEFRGSLPLPEDFAKQAEIRTIKSLRERGVELLNVRHNDMPIDDVMVLARNAFGVLTPTPTPNP